MAIHLWRAIAVWTCLLALAIMNGALREGLLTPLMGPAVGHVVSTLSLSILILITAWLAIPWIAPATARAARHIGALWLGLTLAFEFLAGHFLFGKPWTTLVADYNLAAGRIWILVLVVTYLAPLVAGRIRGLWLR